MNLSLSEWYERVFAAIYDPILAKTEREIFSPLRSRLLSSVHGIVLDLGSGTGANIPYLSNPSLRTVFLDRSFPMVRKGLRKGLRSNGFPVIGSASALPFPNDFFDSIVVSLVLCSVEDPSTSLKEILRTLRQDGRLFLMEHVQSGSPGIAVAQKIATPVWKKLAGGCHLDRPTDAEVLSLFQEEESWKETIGGLPFHFGIYKKKP